jgi:hypothetical protein
MTDLDIIMFVFIGNFASEHIGPMSSNGADKYRENFDKLADIILQFPALACKRYAQSTKRSLTPSSQLIPPMPMPMPMPMPLLVCVCVFGSQFVFVPGPADPMETDVLPKPPIPRSFTKKIRDRIPNATFTSNPCRIRYCTQDIVIFREDLLAKLLRIALPQTALGIDAESTYKHV